MRSLIFFLFAFIFSSLSFVPPAQEEIILTCKVQACDKVPQLHVYEFNGVIFKKIYSAPTADFETYQFTMPATEPRFYYVGIDGNNMKPVILGTEREVELKGTCTQFQSAMLNRSNLNYEYQAIKNILDQNKAAFSQLLRQLQTSQRSDDIDGANAAIIQMGVLDQKQLELIDSLKKANPYLAKIAQLNTYLSYQNHGTGDMTEIEYFARNYFQLTDWTDPALHYMPWVFESIKSWVQTIAAVGLPVDQQKNYIDLLLNDIPDDSRTYMLALGGLINGLQQRKSPLMGEYVKRYIEKYQESEPEAVAQLSQLAKSATGFVPGGEAPDFTMNTPEGTPLSLSDLRGKILLIDFWASWCGPCRRENPNVVAAYNKYHEKGFDVLGVSLDKTHDRWVQAIEKDGLIWHHVSDLKYWSNEAARLYGVSSIPHTVLLDREGRIIARNLRGPALEAKLAELLGE